MSEQHTLTPQAIRALVRSALAEDVGSGDATTLATIPTDLQVSGVLRPREQCVVAGLDVVEAVFRELNPEVVLDRRLNDGESCEVDQTIASVTGSAQAILTGERTALNILQRMSGIATLARAFADAVSAHHTRILDTRKTTPGLRCLEKYAVRCGGGQNHRFGLFDRIMIKDNHLHFAGVDGPGALARMVRQCREQYPKLEIEVEADTLNDVDVALDAEPDYILLDNMSSTEMAVAVTMRDQRNIKVLLEASGGIQLERAEEVARTGVDFISVGALTHSARAIDIGLDIVEKAGYPATG